MTWIIHVGIGLVGGIIFSVAYPELARQWFVTANNSDVWRKNQRNFNPNPKRTDSRRENLGKSSWNGISDLERRGFWF